MKYLSFFIVSICFLLGVMFLSPVQAAYFPANESNPAISSDLNDDAFLAGQSVSVQAPVNGELFGAGNVVTITKRVARSIFAAGNTVTIEEGAGYNVFAAGQTVTLKGTIEHDVYAAGQTVTLDPNVVIKGSLRIGGQNVSLAGNIQGDVYFSGSNVTSSAVIGGMAKGEVDSLTFTGGSIAKDLTYKSNKDASGLNNVTIAGKTTRDTSPRTYQKQRNRSGEIIFPLLTALVAGAALILLVPRKIEEVSETVRTNWGKSFLYGLLALIVTPIAALVILATIVGAPIGLIVMVLYFVLLYLAMVIGKIILGQLLLQVGKVKGANLWWALFVGVVLFAILRLIPVLGGLIAVITFFGLTLPTLGASLLWWKKTLHK